MAQTKSLRQKQEEREHQILGPFASYADESGGRDHEEPQCDIRTDFQRDRDRILHCKAFRRLKQKTQVFLAPEGDHYRTRLTHTLEVAQNARTIARALLLNEDLTEAIALGHDLGHTPFGHAGERALNRISEEYGGFHHNEQSVRVVERLEKDGKGLNLTAEVRDGILNHQTSLMPMTLEGILILTVCDGQLKLGVPGVYHPQEAKAAESFGFPEFLPFEETGLALTEEETNDRETFGYWCRDVRGSEDCADIQRKI